MLKVQVKFIRLGIAKGGNNVSHDTIQHTHAVNWFTHREAIVNGVAILGIARCPCSSSSRWT